MTKPTSFTRTSKNPDFWTDAQQARERIAESYVLYEGSPAYVRMIEDKHDIGIDHHRAYIRTYDEKGVAADTYKNLNDEGFERFRPLPPLGWTNVKSPDYIGAVFLERKARVTRSHGLNDNNTKVFSFFAKGATLAACPVLKAMTVFKNSGYQETCRGVFPPLEDILKVIKTNSAVAYSPKFAVYKDGEGLSWLYRKKKKIGIFTGFDTLSLLPDKNFYREEIMDDPHFTINKIQEF